MVSRSFSGPTYLNATIAKRYTFDVAGGRTAEVNLEWEIGLLGRLCGQSG